MKALGLIETVGLPVAVVAADAAVKSANVSLLGYENTKGGGLITVKLQGDVGAIKAAVQAGTAAARPVGEIYSTHVIARPASGMEMMLSTDNVQKTSEPKAEEPEQPHEGHEQAHENHEQPNEHHEQQHENHEQQHENSMESSEAAENAPPAEEPPKPEPPKPAVRGRKKSREPKS